MADHVLTGSAALSYYLLFSLFPGLIFLLSLLPYLPIKNLHQTVMGFLVQALPTDASNAVESVVTEVTLHRRGGLLSFGILLTLWSASSALSAIMEEINITFEMNDSRPYWRGKLVAIGLAVYLAFLFIISGIFLVGGAWLQSRLLPVTHTVAVSALDGSGLAWLSSWLMQGYLWSLGLTLFFTAFKWLILVLLVQMAFSVTFHFSLDQNQFETPIRFQFLSPGSVVGGVLLFLVSFVFREYVKDVSNYTASYGSLAAVIVLLLWLYLASLVLLIGSEVNALLWSKRDLWAGEPDKLSNSLKAMQGLNPKKLSRPESKLLSSAAVPEPK